MNSIGKLTKFGIVTSIIYLLLTFVIASYSHEEVNTFIILQFPLIIIWGIFWIWGKEKIVYIGKKILSGIVIHDFFSLNGRITRKQYIINIIIISMLVGMTTEIFKLEFGKIGIILALIINTYGMVASIILAVKRCHDIGESGYLLINLTMTLSFLNIMPKNEVILGIQYLVTLLVVAYNLKLIFYKSNRNKNNEEQISYKYEKAFIFSYMSVFIISIFAMAIL